MSKIKSNNKVWSNYKLGRRTGVRGSPKKRILIVCEGERTEPNYFIAFRIPSVYIKVDGLGKNTIELVKSAIVSKDKAESNNKKYDQVWCVFDRDDFPRADFNKALEVAKAHKINVAYSNEAFELWYLLHFCYVNTGVPREDYKKKLSKQMGKTYRKNSTSMYEEILPMQSQAIKFAKKLHKKYLFDKPYDNNPSTTVYKLVEELIKNI